MITLDWIKRKDGGWCRLELVDLTTVIGSGVYIIWHTGNPGRVVRVGQGILANRLGVHRNDKEILKYKQNGELRVTWATVQATQRDGVERYLANHWKPLVGDAWPDVTPLAVNSPW